jgi:hypothetical protein
VVLGALSITYFRTEITQTVIPRYTLSSEEASVAQLVQRQATCWIDGAPSPVGARDLPLLHRVQIGSGTHPASYPVDIGGSFAGSKAAKV